MVRHSLASVLATLSVALAACTPPDDPSPVARDVSSATNALAPTAFTPTALTIVGRERPLAFTRAPPVALALIDTWTPREGQQWPPITSKWENERGHIWPSSLVAGATHYWRLTTAGLLAQGRDLEPFETRVPPSPGPPRPGRLLGIRGDLLITAVSSPGPRARVDIYAADISAPDDPWYVCTLDWPRAVVNGELSVWNQGVGPALAGSEIVMLQDASISHASILDGVVSTLPLDHEPHGLAVGDGRAAWFSDDAELRVALDGFTRLLRLSHPGVARWAGASLILIDGQRLLRWTETRVVELDLPLPDPELGSVWFGDGDVLWLFTPGQTLWRIDEDGFVDLALDLEWPVAARASGGLLVWEIARHDGMYVYSTQPAAGLPFDRTLVEMFEAPD